MSDMDAAKPVVSDAAATPGRGALRGWVVFGILTVTGLGYAYAVFTTISFLTSFAASGLSGYGWFVLIFAAVFPLIVLALVYAIARRRSALELFVAALAGLGVTAVFWLNVLAHVITSMHLFLA